MATIFAADTYGLPVSTTHILSSGVAGTMAANGSGLRWSTVRETSPPAGFSRCPPRLCSPECSTLSSTASPDLFASHFASELWFFRFFDAAFGRRRRFYR
jgi:hypothetical protein